MSRKFISLPLGAQLSGYNGAAFINDLIAALIVTVMLIPQSLAYALLAGLPAEMGLYASILPLVAYALLGSSQTLSVGPVAVASLMTATSVGAVAQSGTADYATAAVMLALMGGLMLMALGFMRFGIVANFLSHPVVSGFITASGVLIAISQFKHLLGIDAHGETLPTLVVTLARNVGDINPYTLAIAGTALAILMFCRNTLTTVLIRIGIPRHSARLISKAAPVAAIVLTTLAVLAFDLEDKGVALVGEVPSGLPAFTTPLLDLGLAKQLLLPALLIALIGFVESVSVGKTLGAKRRQRIDANQELIGLGAANIASAASGGFPVTGGFSRSVVNFDAGAVTQLASIMTAGGIGIAAICLTPALYYLPQATLAATIVVAVSSLIDWSTVRDAWRYSRADFAAVAATILLTLLLGVEIGVMSGVLASIGSHLYTTARPHFAIVGQVPGTQHYRNIERHDVATAPGVLSIRIDESLYFANAAYLEEIIYGQLNEHLDIEHIVLMCSAVNSIDLSALEVLESVNQRLSENAICLHLSEVKGPVMDALGRSRFIEHLHGRVFLHHHAAVQELARV